MTDTSGAPLRSSSAIPADDPKRKLTLADPDSSNVRHVAVVGDSYGILVSGAQTAGRFCLIDMLVPDGSGPPSTSPRFRGDVHAARGRARVHLSR
jgi:hypothetical protein